MNATIATILAIAIMTTQHLCAQTELQGQTLPISDKEVSVLEFEELKYPLVAQYAPFESEGIEVFRVKLDEEGKVVQAEALSGNDLLIPDCLANLKKWRFHPNTTKTAIVVYNLKRSPGECKSASSVFSLRQPNFVTVTGCLTLDIGNPFEFVRLQQPDVISNRDVEVSHWDSGIKYPSLARQARVQGLVVLKVKLDEKGTVVEVVPLAGLPILIPACIANVKNWQFHPNTLRAAVVVYNFSLAVNDPGQAFLQPPNFVTVTAAPIPVQPGQ